MFIHCESLISINLSSFNTANITDFSYMFSGCASLKSIELSNFNTNKAIKNALYVLCMQIISIN